MKKYRLLLAGRNKSVIDEIFYHIDELENLTSSVRYDDIVRHIKYYKPDMFIYCIKNEDSEDISRMISLKTIFHENNVSMAVIGDKPDCIEFEKIASKVADLILTRPISTKSIQEHIELFLRERDKQMLGSKESHGVNQATTSAAKPAAAKLAAASPEQQAKPASAAPASNTGERRKHVLVVDDDIRMLKVVKEHLKENYDVATAINGKLAINFLDKKTTDLILLDYVMPGESGPEVFKQLKSNPATKDIPVLFVTGVDDLSKIREVLKLKPQGYLLKPIDRDKLIAAVEGILG